VGQERGPFSLVSTTEKLLERKSSGSGLENRDYGRRGSAALTTWRSLSVKALVSSREPSLLGTSVTICPIAPAPVDWWVLHNRSNDWQGKPKSSEIAWPRANWFTTNPTWFNLGSNSEHSYGEWYSTTWYEPCLYFISTHRPLYFYRFILPPFPPPALSHTSWERNVIVLSCFPCSSRVPKHRTTICFHSDD
jgi:hypothetical protein